MNIDQAMHGILSVAITLSLLMNGLALGYVIDNNFRLAVISGGLSISTEDRYRGSDAKKDFARVQQELNALKERLDKLEH